MIFELGKRNKVWGNQSFECTSQTSNEIEKQPIRKKKKSKDLLVWILAAMPSTGITMRNIVIIK